MPIFVAIVARSGALDLAFEFSAFINWLLSHKPSEVAPLLCIQKCRLNSGMTTLVLAIPTRRLPWIPGTSCLATIVLSLRDKNHAPIEAPRIILALMGLQTWAKFFGPFGQCAIQPRVRRRERVCQKGQNLGRKEQSLVSSFCKSIEGCDQREALSLGQFLQENRQKRMKTEYSNYE
jgi:hypothetical protein